MGQEGEGEEGLDLYFLSLLICSAHRPRQKLAK